MVNKCLEKEKEINKKVNMNLKVIITKEKDLFD